MATDNLNLVSRNLILHVYYFYSNLDYQHTLRYLTPEPLSHIHNHHSNHFDPPVASTRHINNFLDLHNIFN